MVFAAHPSPRPFRILWPRYIPVLLAALMLAFGPIGRGRGQEANEVKGDEVDGKSDLDAELIRLIEKRLEADRRAREKEPKGDKNIDLAAEIVAARRHGWRWAKILVELLDVGDKQHSAMLALHSQLAKELEGIDPEGDVSEWKAIAVDDLTRNNPRFWEAMYEVAPGSGVLEAIYASMLSGNGEFSRSRHVAVIAKLGRFVTPNTQRVLSTIIAIDQRGVSAGYTESSRESGCSTPKSTKPLVVPNRSWELLSRAVR